MGVLSNKIERQNLKPGDHIYSWRHGYLYAHHGIYVGEGNVIHFTRGRGQEIGTGTVLERIIVSSSPSYHPLGVPCASCGDQSNLEGVIISCIDCFLSGGNLYLFEYGVTRAFFLAKARGGTCTLAPSEPPEDVIYRAKYLLQNGFGSYDVFKNNCENFAMYCKTGLLVINSIGMGQSGQAASFQAAANVFKSAVTTVIISSPLYLTPTFIGLSAVNYGMKYCLSRLKSDIGVRRDVQKVALESLGSSESEVVTEMFNEG